MTDILVRKRHRHIQSKDYVKTQAEDTISKPGREILEETHSDDILISKF